MRARNIGVSNAVVSGKKLFHQRCSHRIAGRDYISISKRREKVFIRHVPYSLEAAVFGYKGVNESCVGAIYIEFIQADATRGHAAYIRGEFSREQVPIVKVHIIRIDVKLHLWERFHRVMEDIAVFELIIRHWFKLIV